MGIKKEKNETGADSPAAPADGQGGGIQGVAQPGPGTKAATERTAETLVFAYLAANLNFKDMPLKQLLNDCEKNILLDCLRLTRGSQRNAAALLGLKPTALFEKMRKHGIDARRIKQSDKITAPPPDEME